MTSVSFNLDQVVTAIKKGVEKNINNGPTEALTEMYENLCPVIDVKDEEKAEIDQVLLPFINSNIITDMMNGTQPLDTNILIDSLAGSFDPESLEQVKLMFNLLAPSILQEVLEQLDSTQELNP